MELRQRIETVLNEQVRPVLGSHGGQITLKGVQDGVVYVTLSGACSGCPSADLSTRGFIEDTLRAAVPEVERVELEHPVSDELLAFARRILSHKD